MDEFFPSEIARLILGYLKEMNCLNTWETFLNESSNLQEYLHLYKERKLYPTNVNGKSLLDILKEYRVLKCEAVSKDNSQLESPENSFFHTSEFGLLKSTKRVIFEEVVKNSVDLVFQKYLPSICSKRDCLSSDVILPDVNTSHFRTDNCGDSENQVPCANDVAKTTSEFRADKCDNNQNLVHFSANLIEKEIINIKENEDEYKQSEVQNNLKHDLLNVDSNISDDNNDHAFKQLNLSQDSMNNTSCRPINSDDILKSESIELHEIVKIENDGLQVSSEMDVGCDLNTYNTTLCQIKNHNEFTDDHSANDECNKELLSDKIKPHQLVQSMSNADSAFIDVKQEDVEVKIIKEIKSDLNNKVQSNSSYISESRKSILKSNLQNSFPFTNQESNDSGDVIINQSETGNTQNTFAQGDNLEHETSSLNSQTRFVIASTQFLNQCTASNKTSFRTFIIPKSTYHILLNIISKENFCDGIRFTLPQLQAKTKESSVLTARVNENSPSASANVSSLMSTGTPTVCSTSLSALKVPANIVPGSALITDNTLDIKKLLPVLNISRPNIVVDTTSVRGKSHSTPVVPETTSKLNFTVDKTAPTVSDFSKACKRKNSKENYLLKQKRTAQR